MADLTVRLPFALLLAAVALLAPAAAQAKTYANCPARSGTLAKDGFGRVWHTKARLYGCTTVHGRKPQTRRLGPWKRGTKVAWDGTQAVSTVALVRDGVPSDRLYAASAGRQALAGRDARAAGDRDDPGGRAPRDGVARIADGTRGHDGQHARTRHGAGRHPRRDTGRILDLRQK